MEVGRKPQTLMVPGLAFLGGIAAAVGGIVWLFKPGGTKAQAAPQRPMPMAQPGAPVPPDQTHPGFSADGQ